MDGLSHGPFHHLCENGYQLKSATFSVMAKDMAAEYVAGLVA